MSNLKERLENRLAKNQKFFVAYVMVGEESLEKTYEDVLFLEKAGATLIELGVPFSDPVTDGVVIQESGIKSLKNGTTLADVLALVEKIRKVSDIPLLLMGYLNPFYKYGFENFFKEAKRVGVEGVIIPDLPLEEFPLISDYVKNYGIDYIPFFSPTTPIERINSLCEVGGGFLYVVTSLGVTGEKDLDKESLRKALKEIKSHSSLPIAAGFGISSKEDIAGIIDSCDGVIVGTKIIKLLRANDYKGLEDLMEGFRV